MYALLTLSPGKAFWAHVSLSAEGHWLQQSELGFSSLSKWLFSVLGSSEVGAATS